VPAHRTAPLDAQQIPPQRRGIRPEPEPHRGGIQCAPLDDRTSTVALGPPPTEGLANPAYPTHALNRTVLFEL
jgi:hypothetical protein